MPLLLLLYNAIFVAPLLAITVVSSILARKLSVLKKRRGKLIKVFNMAENTLLIFLHCFCY
ncbi:MAG: hypothetical protein DRN04_08140 [Thermoprotei archaeon]|nr:MAG: hypothetical protein DRN04_08140 [Thermoprotei archaeon]